MKPGEAPDRVVAEALGVSVTTVFKMRKEQGIPNYRDHHIDWSVIDPELPGLSVRAAAKKFGIDRNRIHARKKMLEKKDKE